MSAGAGIHGGGDNGAVTGKSTSSAGAVPLNVENNPQSSATILSNFLSSMSAASYACTSNSDSDTSDSNTSEGGDDSNDSYFSTSHASSSGAVAQLMQETILSSQVEAASAQVEEQDGIQNALEGSNAQLSNSVLAAQDQESATDTAAYGAIAGAAISIGATTMGNMRGSSMSEEDQEKQTGLSNTKSALHSTQKDTTTTCDDQASVQADERLSDLSEDDEAGISPTNRGMNTNESDEGEWIEMSEFGRGSFSSSDLGDSGFDANFDSNSLDSRDSDVDFNRMSATEANGAQSDMGSEGEQFELTENNLAAHNGTQQEEDGATVEKGSAASNPAVKYSEQDKQDLLAYGFLKGPGGAEKTQAIINDLNGAEKAKLTQTVAMQEEQLASKQTARVNENNVTRQVWETAGQALNTTVTQASSITAADLTKRSQILSALAQALNSSIQSAQSSTAIGASILQSCESAVGSLTSSISSLLVNNQ